MSSEFGKSINVSIFGQSHSEGIGVVIDGLPPNEEIDLDALQAFLKRRAPGQAAHTTKRREADVPKILSGLYNGKTSGAPLCAVIENTDVRSQDYNNIADIPRPSHADFPAYVKYKGANDPRGGGHFSARLTAPLCFAGGVALQILKRRGIFVGAHISEIAGISDMAFDPMSVTGADFAAIQKKDFPVIDDCAGERMREAVVAAFHNLDSVGGVVECASVGLPTGLGNPIFDGVENTVAKIVFGIPAVRGIEFGAGFSAAKMKGSQHNDPFCMKDGEIRTSKNDHGGVLGGITSGMPLIFRVAFKPTPSISREQSSVSFSEHTEKKLVIKGRHDPCVVPRAVPVVEAAAALAILELYMKG
jgi:chorismate synthase